MFKAYNEDDLCDNFDLFSSFQHLVDVMEARIKQVTQVYQVLIIDPS